MIQEFFSSQVRLQASLTVSPEASVPTLPGYRGTILPKIASTLALLALLVMTSALSTIGAFAEASAKDAATDVPPPGIIPMSMTLRDLLAANQQAAGR